MQTVFLVIQRFGGRGPQWWDAGEDRDIRHRPTGRLGWIPTGRWVGSPASATLFPATCHGWYEAEEEAREWIGLDADTIWAIVAVLRPTPTPTKETP